MHRASSDFFDAAAGERLADAAVHARGGERFGALGQRLDRGVDRMRGRRAARRLATRASSASMASRSSRPTAGRRRRPAPSAWPAACARPRPAPRAARARACRARRCAKPSLQHARDVVVGQAVAGLDGDRGLDAATSARAPTPAAARRHRPGSVTRMRAAPATIGGMPRSSKRASERQSATSSRSPCTTWMRHRGLAVLEGGEVLRLGDRDRAVALDDALDQAAHRLEAQRQRDHVEQQQLAVASRCRPARWPGWPRRARPPRRGSGRSAARGRRTRPPRVRTAGMRVEPPTSTTPCTSSRVTFASRSTLRTAASVRSISGLRERIELRAATRRRHSVAVGERAAQRRASASDSASLAARAATSSGALVVAACRPRAPACASAQSASSAVEVVAAERRVAAGGDDLEHALRQPQQRDVEGAAAEVVDRVEALAAVVQPVGDGRRGRLVDQAQHVQAGQLRGVLGRLALRVVEVGRHGDHRAEQVVASKLSSARWRSVARISADTSTGDFDAVARRAARPCPARRRSGTAACAVPATSASAAAHEALDRDDGVARVVGLRRQRVVADLARARRRGSARPTAAARGPARRAGIRPRRGAPRPRANASCRGRCRPRCAAGAGRATGRVRRSAAAPCESVTVPARRGGARCRRGSARRTSVRCTCRCGRSQSSRRRRAVAAARRASRARCAATSPASASSSGVACGVVERLAPCHLLRQEGAGIAVLSRRRSARRAVRTGRRRARSGSFRRR